MGDKGNQMWEEGNKENGRWMKWMKTGDEVK